MIQPNRSATTSPPAAQPPIDRTSAPIKSSFALSEIAPIVCLIVAALFIEAILWSLTSLWFLPRFFPGPGVSIEFHEMFGDANWLAATIWQVGAFIGLFLAYAAALFTTRRIRNRRAVLAVVFIAPIVWACTTVFMYPPYAVDLFHYLGEIRLMWVYGLNPMVVAPSARPFPIGVSFFNVPGDYGPLWYVIGFPASLFHQRNLLYAVIALKAWIAVFYLLSGVLVYKTMRVQREERATFSAVLYLWSPFIIIRALGDAHNDFVMIFFVFLAFYVAARGKWLFVYPTLILSFLVKYASLLIAPLFLVYILFLPRERRYQALRQLLTGGVVAAIMAIALFIPFWDGIKTFASLRYIESQSITSTALLVQYFITEPFLGDKMGGISRLWVQILFLIPYAWFVFRVRPPIERLEGAAYQILWFYVVLALAWFRPWYFAWVVALGALLPWGWYLALTLTISFVAMFPDIVEQYRVHIPWVAGNFTAATLAPIVVAFLLPVIVWLAGAVQTGSFSFLPARGRIPELAEHTAD